MKNQHMQQKKKINLNKQRQQSKKISLPTNNNFNFFQRFPINK